MNNNKNSGWSMPLMEMIIAVCFFILCAGVCVRVFAKAESMSRIADETSYSIMMSQNIAEAVKAEGEAGLTETLGAIAVEDGHFRMEWSVEDGQTYQADIRTSEADDMLQADIAISKKEQVLYELSVSKYLGMLPGGSSS